jgi:hypothetical protein
MQLAAKLQKKSEIIQRHLFTLKREGRATPLMEKDKAIRASKARRTACPSPQTLEEGGCTPPLG